MEMFGRVFALILAAILVMLFPLQYLAQLQSETIDDVVCLHTDEFTETARHQGYITQDMYDDLIYQMDQTGELYDINIEVSHPVSGKTISEVSVGDVIPELQLEPTSNTSETDNKSIVSLGLTDRQVTDERNGISLFATHSHTNDCYAGHKHTGNCIQQNNYILKGGPIAESYWGRVMYFNQRRVVSIVCKYCMGETGQVTLYEGWSNLDPRIEASPMNCGTYNSSYYFGAYFSYYTLKYMFGSSGSTGGYTANPKWDSCLSAFNNLGGPVSWWTSSSYSGWFEISLDKLKAINGYDTSFGCAFCTYNYRSTLPISWVYQYNYCESVYDASGTRYSISLQENNTPICSTVVTSLIASLPTQTVKKGNSIVTTATATYLDGHTGTVNCNVSGYSPNQTGTQTVTLTYSGLVTNAKTTGTKTCSTVVTVQEDNIPSFFTVTLSSPTVYNGTEPSYTVVLTYTSGATKTLTSLEYTRTGWTTGYGNKTVTFSYSQNGITISKSVTITVLPNLTGLSVTPASQTIKRYTNANITVTASYEDGTNKTILNGYTVTGFNNNNLGIQSATVSYTENGITRSNTTTLTVTKLTTICPICGTNYELDNKDIDLGCPVCSALAASIIVAPTYINVHQGEELPITVTVLYQNGRSAMVTGWISNYNPYLFGIHEVKVEYQGLSTYIMVETSSAEAVCLICGNLYNHNSDGTDPGCPICKNVMTSINVLENNIVIEKHHSLPITVEATYKDGHKVIISDWITYFISDTVGSYEATVYSGTLTDKVNVKVIDNNLIICSYCGLEYDKTDYLYGCPLCSKTIIGIEASLRNGGTQILCKSQINLQIVLLFKDTRRKLILSGYEVSGFNSDILGFQSVHITYDTFSTTLTVEVIPSPVKMTCPNKHEYYLNEDGSNPGCPYCDSTDKDAAVFYFVTIFTNEIVETLYRDGIIYISEGDYLTVTITQKDASIRSRLKKMFFGTNSGIAKKRYMFGGEVL